jgi:hypothetical protein
MALTHHPQTPERLSIVSHQSSGRRIWGAALLLAVVSLVLVGLGEPAMAATRSVANNGVDSPSCGGISTPCRSVRQAIANAVAGDTVVVGPGVYRADLNAKGIFGESGEEAPEVGSGCFCMIKVNKLLTLLARTWAKATVLDAIDLANANMGVAVVGIAASGVTIGTPNQGFTLINGGLGG